MQTTRIPKTERLRRPYLGDPEIDAIETCRMLLVKIIAEYTKYDGKRVDRDKILELLDIIIEEALERSKEFFFELGSGNDAEGILEGLANLHILDVDRTRQKFSVTEWGERLLLEEFNEKIKIYTGIDDFTQLVKNRIT